MLKMIGLKETVRHGLLGTVIEGDKLIYEIAAITQTSPDEVLEFYRRHNYSLDFIKRAVLIGCRLNVGEMEKAIFVKDLKEVYPRTWKDYYLPNIPFYFAYWLSYPFIWLVYWLWQGIIRAKAEVWD